MRLLGASGTTRSTCGGSLGAAAAGDAAAPVAIGVAPGLGEIVPEPGVAGLGEETGLTAGRVDALGLAAGWSGDALGLAMRCGDDPPDPAAALAGAPRTTAGLAESAGAGCTVPADGEGNAALSGSGDDGAAPPPGSTSGAIPPSSPMRVHRDPTTSCFGSIGAVFLSNVITSVAADPAVDAPWRSMAGLPAPATASEGTTAATGEVPTPGPRAAGAEAPAFVTSDR